MRIREAPGLQPFPAETGKLIRPPLLRMIQPQIRLTEPP